MPNEQVTILIYTFPPAGKEDEAFSRIQSSIERAWKLIGERPTVIVASHHFKVVDDFAAAHANVTLQIEPTIIPGNIKTMSMDCIKRLYTRFMTPYVLIIQDDGFPLRDNLEDFLGKIDFWGAPIISDGWKRELAYGIGLGSFNGGFSLRSRRCCEQVAHYWNTKYHTLGDCRASSEDLFVTDFLPRHERAFRKAMRFPEIRKALRFSYEAIAPYKGKTLPFGFHRLDSKEVLEDISE